MDGGELDDMIDLTDSFNMIFNLNGENGWKDGEDGWKDGGEKWRNENEDIEEFDWESIIEM